MSKKKSHISRLFLDLPLGAEFEAKINSASMLPIFLVGDSVLVKKIKFDQAKIGDIICFYQDFEESLIVHRLVAKHWSTSKPSFELVTKGDASSNVDFNPVRENNFVGLVVGKASRNSKNRGFRKFLFIITQRIFLKHQSIRDFFY